MFISSRSCSTARPPRSAGRRISAGPRRRRRGRSTPSASRRSDGPRGRRRPGTRPGRRTSVQVFEGPKLGPERPSGEAAEDQDDGLLPAVIGQGDAPRLIVRLQGERRRLLAEARPLGGRPDLAGEQALQQRRSATVPPRPAGFPPLAVALGGAGGGIEQVREVILGEELLPVRRLLERLLPFLQRDPAVPIPSICEKRPRAWARPWSSASGATNRDPRR